MMKTMHSPGRILLSHGYARIENNNQRTISIYNGGNDSLHSVQEITLAGGHTKNVHLQPGQSLLVLPVVGNIVLTIAGEEQVLAPGLLLNYQTNQEEQIAVYNPNKAQNDLVNYLCFIVKDIVPSTALLQIYPFDFSKANTLNVIEISGNNKKIGRFMIGQFGGRQEALQTIEEGHSVFVYALQGAFEVQGRLLHPTDGLLLWQQTEVDLEALSNEAIILMVETRE